MATNRRIFDILAYVCVTLVLLLQLSATLGSNWSRNRVEDQQTKKYTRGVFGIKSGIEDDFSFTFIKNDEFNESKEVLVPRVAILFADFLNVIVWVMLQFSYSWVACFSENLGSKVRLYLMVWAGDTFD